MAADRLPAERGVNALTDRAIWRCRSTSRIMEALAFLDASFPAGAALPEQANAARTTRRVLRRLPRIDRPAPAASLGYAIDPADSGQGARPTNIGRRSSEHSRSAATGLSYWAPSTPTSRAAIVSHLRLFFRPEGHAIWTRHCWRSRLR